MASQASCPAVWCGAVLTCGQGVTAMVKQLPQGAISASAPRLLAVNGIKTLVDEEPQGTQEARPSRHLCVTPVVR